jgi:hypothetical protein
MLAIQGGAISARGAINDLLLRRIDGVRAEWRSVTLDAEHEGAWLLFHGLMAFGDALRVRLPRDAGAKSASGMEWLLSGADIPGLGAECDSDGVPRFRVSPGVSGAQEHVDQWLGCLLLNKGIDGGVGFRIDRDTAGLVRIDERDVYYTIGDLVQDAWLRARLDQELAWSLIALSAFPETADSAATALSELVKVEALRSRASLSCGGSHSRIGLAVALERHRRGGDNVEGADGAWGLAQVAIDEYVQYLRRIQQPCGAFFARELDSGVPAADRSMHLRISGHAMQFLALALDGDDLSQPWLQQGAEFLCRLLEQVPRRPSGDAYHALHALSVFVSKVSRYGAGRAVGSIGAAVPAVAVDHGEPLACSSGVRFLALSDLDGGVGPY